jgi:hypothetical protein
MSKDLVQKDLWIYNTARKFLLANTPTEVTEEVLDSYLSPPALTHDNLSIKDLYYRLLGSAQNANMKAGVIGRSIGGVQNLGQVLYSFNPRKVKEKYSGNPELLLNDIIKKLKPNGKIRRTSRSIWPRYCRTIISAAEFFNQFSDAKEFFEWVEHYYKDKKSISALPMVFDAEIYGIGFPLACDFLKELGYKNYGKPDVHIKEIFIAASLIPKGSSDYQTLKALIRIANHVDVTVYNVDKLFWLIGSGYFYNHEHIGNQGRVNRMKEAFIEKIT